MKTGNGKLAAQLSESMANGEPAAHPEVARKPFKQVLHLVGTSCPTQFLG
jgi:hypothetical protein